MLTPAPAIKAFLDIIAMAEGTSTSAITVNDGYDIIVTGLTGPSKFTDYSDHPFANGGSVLWREPDIPSNRSTAAGRYQILAHYWKAYKSMLRLPDFTPPSQDAVALQQMKERGAIALIAAGDIEGAIKACSNIWASLPGSPYGQPTKPMALLLDKYTEFTSV